MLAIPSFSYSYFSSSKSLKIRRVSVFTNSSLVKSNRLTFLGYMTFKMLIQILSSLFWLILYLYYFQFISDCWLIFSHISDNLDVSMSLYSCTRIDTWSRCSFTISISVRSSWIWSVISFYSTISLDRISSALVRLRTRFSLSTLLVLPWAYYSSDSFIMVVLASRDSRVFFFCRIMDW